jgi:ribosomal protein S6
VIVLALSMEKKETHNDSRMKVYELGLLLVSSIPEEHVATEFQAIKTLIEQHEGMFISEDFPKLRPLAYTMIKAVGSQRNRHDKGYFGWVKFEMATAMLPKLKTELDKNDNILRFMLIETVRENTMMTQKMIFKPADAPMKDDAAPASEEAGVKEPVSEEELDKTIDNLVV